jgi:hypothetical protein
MPTSHDDVPPQTEEHQGIKDEAKESREEQLQMVRVLSVLSEARRRTIMYSKTTLAM